jgi:hypothetical protein
MFGAMPVGAVPAKGRRVLVPAGMRFTPPTADKPPAG